MIILLLGPEFEYISETTREKFKTVCKKDTIYMIYRKMGEDFNNVPEKEGYMKKVVLNLAIKNI